MKKKPYFREQIRLSINPEFSYREAANLAGIAPNTVRKYRRICLDTKQDWSQLSKLDDLALARHFITSKSRITDKRMPDWQMVHQQMQIKHQTLIQLWEEYRLIEPETAYAYSQFTHYYREYLGKIDITMRQVHYAGEAAYVDYAGQTIPWTDPKTGEEHQAQIFVGVLGCSNYTFAYAFRSQKIEDWIDAHNRMIYFFGGVPQVVVPDNLKSAVICPGSEPTINRTYLEFSRHNNCVILPARVRKPQDKSKAELGVLLVTRWITVPLHRRQFFSIAEINEAIAELLVKLNQRPFKRLPGNRQSRFEALDKPALQPLPDKPFQYAQWQTPQKVGPDYHVHIKQHAYSVPYRLVKEKVEARITRNLIEIYYQNQLVATHSRSFEVGGHTTDPLHRPIQHQVYAEQSKDDFVNWAKTIGVCATQIIQQQFVNKPEYSLVSRKACSNLNRLARQYGHERFEHACERAIAIQSLTYKSVHSILKSGLDKQQIDDANNVSIPEHINIRGAEYYQGGDAHVG